MRISVPVPIASYTTDNVSDDTPEFEVWEKTVYDEGQEVQWTGLEKDSTTEYDSAIYVATEEIVVLDYDPLKTDYVIGDVVWGEGTDDSTPNQVMYATEGEVPMPPPQYITDWTDETTPVGVETDWDYTTWTERYFMVSSTAFVVGTSYDYVYYDGTNYLQYFFTIVGDSIQTVCWVWSTYNAVDDEYSNPVGLSVVAYNKIHTLISDITEEPVAYTETRGTSTVIMPDFVFMDDNGVYFRTNVTATSADADTVYVTDAMLFKAIEHPTDIPAFTYLRENNAAAAFDGANYTKVTGDDGETYIEYIITADDIKFNMFALGYVKASGYTYEFSSDGGTKTYGSGGDITNASNPTSVLPIECNRDDDCILCDWYTTIVVYAEDDGNGDGDVVPAGGQVLIRIYYPDDEGVAGNAADIEVGTIMIGGGVDAGFTNLALTNKYRDFSVFEYDVWGNASYTERAKVSVYSGSVDIPVTDYDMTDRLMTSLGQNIVIMDGSDNNANAEPDSTNIFAATQKIGRILAFQQQTKVKGDDMEKLATYTFTLEEIV